MTAAVPVRADAERAAAALAEAGVGRVVLFGSVARDEANERSDIDLMAAYDDLDYTKRWEKHCELNSRTAENAKNGRLPPPSLWAQPPPPPLRSLSRCRRVGRASVQRDEPK